MQFTEEGPLGVMSSLLSNWCVVVTAQKLVYKAILGLVTGTHTKCASG